LIEIDLGLFRARDRVAHDLPARGAWRARKWRMV
jgi:hypothetical protein